MDLFWDAPPVARILEFDSENKIEDTVRKTFEHRDIKRENND